MNWISAESREKEEKKKAGRRIAPPVIQLRANVIPGRGHYSNVEK